MSSGAVASKKFPVAEQPAINKRVSKRVSKRAITGTARRIGRDRLRGAEFIKGMEKHLSAENRFLAEVNGSSPAFGYTKFRKTKEIFMPENMIDSQE
jgi:hypothetical protein